MKVAVLTRNERLFRLVCDAFAGENVICSSFAEDLALVRELPRQTFSLILIDANHGQYASHHPLSSWRECYSDRRTPVIVIEQFFNLDNLKDTLASGADDVVFGPVNPRELNARAHILLNRNKARDQSSAQIETNGYVLDKRNGSVFANGHAIRLTSREFAIAWLLFSNLGNFLSRQQISEAIWGNYEDIVGRTLEQHIYKLRKKLDLNETSGVQLKTIYAFGYRLEAIQTEKKSGASASASVASFCY
ncbi:transcriptional regulator [Mycoavidus sp. B2-EB]|nr:transcriptional regulator [Mycoavidus sp. B2-EB]